MIARAWRFFQLGDVPFGPSLVMVAGLVVVAFFAGVQWRMDQDFAALADMEARADRLELQLNAAEAACGRWDTYRAVPDLEGRP